MAKKKPVKKQAPFQSGAVVDERPESEKLKDYKAEELIASFNPVSWTEKPQSSWRKFPIFNQNGSGSCVAQTEAKEMGIMRMQNSPEDGYIHFSATHIYQRRSNKPAAGMAAVDARTIASQGVTLENFVQSQNMTDAQMDSAVVKPYEKLVGEVFKTPNYVALPVKDIDTIASMIQTTGKGVMVWFYFDYPEWTEHPKVLTQNLDLYAPATARHSVCAVDFTLVNGKKCLIIEDSWGTAYGMAGQRVIDEDFFKARNWYAGYLVNFRFEEQAQPEKPRYTFTKVLEFGQTNNDIKALQDILKYEGLFPVNTSSTGYFGSVTAKAVLQWQIKHAVAALEELNQLQGRRVGSKTIEKLNELYG